MDLARLLTSLRRATKLGVWGSGVKLARDGAVAVESRDDDEIVLRVRVTGRLVAHVVVLYPGENEWDCDCPVRVRPCEHIAAAAIAVSQAPGGGTDVGANTGAAALAASPVPTAQRDWRRVVYRLSKVEGGVQVRRFLVGGDGIEVPLQGTLLGLLARPATAASLHVEQADLKADLLLETGARVALPPTKLDALLAVLVGARNVFLDGRSVAISDEEFLPLAVVEDSGADVVVTMRRDPRVTDVPSVGIVLAGDVLARHGETELCGGWLQSLPITKTYRAAEVGHLTSKVLPELSRRMVVDVRSKRIPKIVRGIEPRIVLELGQVGGALSVLPKLVYGSPPCARVDDTRLVHLGGPLPVRDEPLERRLVEKLRADLDLLPGRRTTYEGEDTARFVERLRRWRGDLTGDAVALINKRVKLEPRLRVHEAAGQAVRFAFTFDVQGGGGEGEARSAEAGAVVRAWREGLGLVPLEGGGWAPLPQAWLDKHGDTLASLLAARAADGGVANHALPALGELCADLNQPPPAGLQRLAPLFAAFDRLPEAALPQDLTATLRPYQRVAVNWLAFLRGAGLGGVLADDMGLGKTVEALSVFLPRTLVVCPTSVLPNWQSEIARFRPRLRVAAHHGPARRLDPTADVTLTTYAILRLDAQELAARRWNAVVLDEAQAIKNPDSQVARAAYTLDADFRLALSGTPVENRLDELWSLMNFANRGLLGGRRDFDTEHTRPIAEGAAGAADRLRQRIRPFVLRRRKAEVAPELPPRTEATMKVALTDPERALYDAVRAASRAEMVAAMGSSNVMKALEALLRLRQAACHPGLLPGQAAVTSSKTEALAEALVNAAADGHKALVFSQWTSFLDLIEPVLNNAGVAFLRLDGSTRDRGAVVDAFQSSGGPPVMLVSLKAGGTGLNLTAADHVFLCDPWWNPAVEDQAADRAHRIGQDRPVMIYRLVAIDTVEERILALQQSKRALGDAALGDAGAAASLTREDLLALLD